MITKSIGKITSIYMGYGGYQDAMIGLTIHLGSPEQGWGTSDFLGFWGPGVKHSKHCKWTDQSRVKTHGETMMFLGDLLNKAKKNRLEELKDIPVEVTFTDHKLESWRILTEVL